MAMLHIKYNTKESTAVIVSEYRVEVTLRDVSVEKEEGAIRIKGTRFFSYHSFYDIRDEVYLKR